MNRILAFILIVNMCVVCSVATTVSGLARSDDGTGEIASRITIEVVPGVAVEMVYIPGGTFNMGATAEQVSHAADDEYPVHSVTLSGYYIATTECTQRLWNVIMKDNPSMLKGDLLPVTNVDIYDCDEFVAELSARTHHHFALPTEAQWEYAARGGSLGESACFSGGNDINRLAWYKSNASQPRTVATKLPNDLGLYDMSGNVYEICDDEYKAYESQPVEEPRAKGSGQQVFRGGAYNSTVSDCRTTARAFAPSDFSADFIGFRLVLLP